MATVRLDRDEATDGYLPQLCLKCGATATVERTQTFSWCPSWVGILILAGLLPYIIVAAIMTRRLTVHAPLCDDHRNHWAMRNWFLWGGLIVCVLLGVVSGVVLAALDNRPGARPSGANPLGGLLCVGSVVIGLAWLIAVAIFQHTGIRTTEITEYDITLVNVSRDFVDAVKEYRRRDRDDEYRRRDRDDNPYRLPPRGWTREDDDTFRERGGP